MSMFEPLMYLVWLVGALLFISAKTAKMGVMLIIVGASLFVYQNTIRTPNITMAILSAILLGVFILRLVKPGIFPDRKHK